MPRGGSRINAGRKPKWVHSQTTIVRIPAVLEEQILAFAEFVDKSENPSTVTALDFVTNTKKNAENVTKSEIPKEKVVNLSRVAVSRMEGKTFVFLSDLVKAGYIIEPAVLFSVVQSEGKK
jgi:hypothetical protein